MGRGAGKERDNKSLRFDARADRRGLTGHQFGTVVCGTLVIVAAWRWNGSATLAVLELAVQGAFLICAAWRILLILASRWPQPPSPVPEVLTPYTILVALHDEVDVMDQLVERLSRIDYPHDRLQGLLLVEAHDLETIQAAQAADRPEWLQVVVVPLGLPLTKPRALNHGLSMATGGLVTVYDAEDDPDPLQLREAASRFEADGDPRLACLQAPLRIRRRHDTAPRSAFLHRQFAVEYAALFEVTLPGMARLGLPFPLGGTSNHFRTDVLRSLGGWDAYNVTEDADLGFRLWRNGWRSGLIQRPTYEVPPNELEDWLPQRTRWLKGFMQTWGVHTRDLRGLGVRGILALIMTLGSTIAAAAAHALALAWLASSVLIALFSGLSPATPMFAVSVLILGTAAAVLINKIGAQRAHVPYDANDMVMSPVYWSLLTLAFCQAFWRLIAEPFAWDKTRHRPDPVPLTVAAEDAGRRAA